jgi:5-methylcytosine-specific restriction endonuclease McrA
MPTDEGSCWLCGRPLGSRIEYHHLIPKSRGGRATIPIHPICHRTLHRTF